MEENYSESVNKEFEAMEGSPVAEQKPAGLGRVNIAYDPTEDLREINEKIGYIPLVMANLPSGARFYRSDMKISIRAARVAEIRDFSTMDENNLFDVDEKLNNILAACARIEFGNRKGSHKDILEEDRIFVLLSIRELTFKQGESRLAIKQSCKACGHENDYEIKTSLLQYQDTSDLDKYYDAEGRCFTFETKSSGIIKMAPPTIGVMKVITEYIKTKEEKKEKWDKAFMQVLPFLYREWRGFDEKTIQGASIEFQGWSTTKYTTVYRLAEKMRVGVKQELDLLCNSCEAEVTVPITFPGGVKSLFVVSDISEELL